ncbi:hypothetical protein [Vibrio hyugaensis]|uniref:hypothetical protein n=1 Tax=Vibrio hyugaensis TaxID=1534743 RepID=UPI0005EF42C2|nr:hypothetical protein [Vibrio hyugaensis]
MFVKRYAQYSVKRPWFHRINILFVLLVFVVSAYELLENEEFIYLLGVAFTFLATALFASASSFKKRYLGHES